MGRGGGWPYASWWSTCCATTSFAEQRRVHMVSHSTHSARLHTTAQSFLLEWRAQLHTVSYIRPRLLSSPEARGPPPPPLNYRPEPSQPLCLEQQNRDNLLQSTYHQVARSEIAPQSNNGSCPIICPRLWSASCSDGTTRRKVDFARYGVNSPTTKSQLGHYSPPTNELPSPLPPSLPYTWNL